MDNLEEMDKFLEKYNFSKLNQEEIENINRLIKKQREKNKIHKIRDENGDITIDNTEIQRILRDYYQQLYAYEMDNLEEMDEFLEKHKLAKLNREEIENLNRPIKSMEIETVIKIFQETKAKNHMPSQMNSTKNLEKS